MGNAGLLIAGALSSCALIYTAPAALPEKNLLGSLKSAFMTSLSLACAFLLTDAVWLTANALWGVNAAVMLCALFSFIFTKLTVWVFTPNTHTSFLTASAAVLVLTQPQAVSWMDSVLFAIGTAVGIIGLLTALSPVLRRSNFSDAPLCIKGLPSLLFILGISALAFGGF